MATNRLGSILVKLFYGLIIVLTATLTGYRLKIVVKDYISLSSKYIISSLSKTNIEDVQFPTISICNINPAKGSALLAADHKSGAPQDYELFVDSINGRINTDVSAERLNRPIFQIIDQASHKLQDMMKHCRIGKKKCNHVNFTKSLLPTGACFTYNGNILPHDDITLVLNPEIYEYIIPNAGYAGFRLLVHSLNNPLWVNLPSSMYVGPNFHTYVRVNAIEKTYKRLCSEHDYWILCMHRCFEQSIFKACNCYLMGQNACTFSHIMKCGLNIGNIKEFVLPTNCQCSKRCNQVTYKFESVSQSLKNNLFSKFMFPWSSDKNQNAKSKVFKQGKLVQLWAYLRESNITAFEDLRQLSIYLEKLIYFLGDLEKNIKIYQEKWQKLKTIKCQKNEELLKKSNKMYQSGMNFIISMKNMSLFDELSSSPKELIHVHLVHLFFSGITQQLIDMENTIDRSDFMTELSVFQYSPSDVNCGHSAQQISSNVEIKEMNDNSDENINSKDLSHYLQKLFFMFTTNFKKFKKSFEKTVNENVNLIGTVSNLSFKPSVEDDYYKNLVTITVQMLINDNMAYQMESIQNIYDPQLAIIDILMSGLVISFVFLTLANKCFNLKYSFRTKKISLEGIDHRSGPLTLSQYNINPYISEVTIKNNLSQKLNQHEYNKFQEKSNQMTYMELPITNFHLI